MSANDRLFELGRKAHLLRCLTHEHEALGVGDDLGGIEGLLEVVDELLLVALERLLLGAVNNLAGAYSLGLERRQAPGEDCLSDKGD